MSPRTSLTATSSRRNMGLDGSIRMEAVVSTSRDLKLTASRAGRWSRPRSATFSSPLAGSWRRHSAARLAPVLLFCRRRTGETLTGSAGRPPALLRQVYQLGQVRQVLCCDLIGCCVLRLLAVGPGDLRVEEAAGLPPSSPLRPVLHLFQSQVQHLHQVVPSPGHRPDLRPEDDPEHRGASQVLDLGPSPPPGGVLVRLGGVQP